MLGRKCPSHVPGYRRRIWARCLAGYSRGFKREENRCLGGGGFSCLAHGLGALGMRKEAAAAPAPPLHLRGPCRAINAGSGGCGHSSLEKDQEGRARAAQLQVQRALKQSTLQKQRPGKEPLFVRSRRRKGWHSPFRWGSLAVEGSIH